MKPKRMVCVLICLAGVSAFAADPSVTPTPSESPASKLVESVSEISAQRAATERSRIYHAGADYGHWLDQIAQDSDNPFLQRAVFDHVTWMRLLAFAAALVFLSLLAVGFLWIVRRTAGEIQSDKPQSPLALAASALRKPVALFLWACGGAFALMPIATGIDSRATRLFCVRTLTALFYAGWIIAVLWLVLRAILAIEKRMQLWTERTASLVGKVMIPIAGQTLRMAVPLLGVILLLPLLRLPDNWAWVTEKAFGILLIVALSFLIIRAINAVQAALMSRHRMDLPDNLSARRIHTQVSVIRKILVTAIVIIATGSILMLFNPVRQFGTSILASAGIAGIVIGFAAQKTLGNLLAGIQIALSRPVLIDDVVVVEGEYGRIEEITLAYVTVRTWDLRRLVLPITYFVEKPFQNWSRISTDLIGTIILYLDYHVPMGEVRRELKRLVENNQKWDGKVCGVQVTDAKQSTIEVRALVSSTDPGKLGDLRCEIREGLIEFLCREHPETLPRVRNINVEETPTSGQGGASGIETVSGQQHELGSKSPGLRTEEDGDGAS